MTAAAWASAPAQHAVSQLLQQNGCRGQPTVKVCDFGIAREITGTFLDTSTDSLSLAWAAPEQRMHNLIPREADIYAFGVMHALAVCKVAGAMQVCAVCASRLWLGSKGLLSDEQLCFVCTLSTTIR